MATKNYMINDKWLDLDKQNIVELQSVDGVLDSLKVNGSEIETPSGKITITENGTDIDIAQYATADVSVEGGGGSSDFSTAEVTLVCDGFDNDEGTGKIDGCFINNNAIDWFVNIETAAPGTLGTFLAVLYKGVGTAFAYPGALVSISGDIVADENGNLTITGNGTIHYLTFEP